MRIRFVENPRGEQKDNPYPGDIMCIDDAHILYPNFSGKVDSMNQQGKRQFVLLITDAEVCTDVLKDFSTPVTKWTEMEAMDVANFLKEKYGYNVSIKPGREPGDAPFIKMKISVSYNGRSRPDVYLDVNGTRTPLHEGTVGQLDFAEIVTADMDIRPFYVIKPEYNYKGISAILNGMIAHIRASRFVNFEAGPIMEDPKAL